MYKITVLLGNIFLTVLKQSHVAVAEPKYWIDLLCLQLHKACIFLFFSFTFSGMMGR